MSDPLFIVAVLAANVVISEILVRRTALKHLGTALLVIVVTAITANIGVIPSYSDEVAVYRIVFSHLAPMSIFWLLLRVEIRSVLAAGRLLLTLFAIGMVGTVLGAIAGIFAIGGVDRLGDHGSVLGGMFVATYTGGSVNFNAVALEYEVVQDGVVYAAAAAVDSLMTTLWMAATIVIPRFMRRGAPAGESLASVRPEGEVITGVEDDTESLHAVDLAWLLLAGAGCVWLSGFLGSQIDARLGIDLPDILILTTLALVLAQFPVVARLRGTRTVGMFGVYLFLAVIGALCDLGALRESGELGLALLIFASVLVAVHGIVTFGAAKLFRLDPDAAGVASQANIGGGASALALARSLGRGDLVLPAILLGSIGTALGSYLGFLVVRILG